LRNFSKTSVLDQCINGNLDNFNELLDTAFDHFNVFYLFCKEAVGSKNIDSVKYDGINDGSATFNIVCGAKYTSPDLSGLSISNRHKVADHLVQLERTKEGVSFNILIKE
jgi:hypothetical protein